MTNLQLLEDKYLKAKIKYYEGEPFLTDTEFDALEVHEKFKNREKMKKSMENRGCQGPPGSFFSEWRR